MTRFQHSMIFVVLAGALVFFQYHLWFESGGIRDMIRLKKMLSETSIENDKLKKRNDELLVQIERIQNSQDASEARARSELGMVKNGEVFYQVVK